MNDKFISVFNILSISVLILAGFFDLRNGSNISSYIFFLTTLVLTIYVFICFFKKKTKIKNVLLFSLFAVMINLYAVIDAFFPFIFEKYSFINSYVSMFMYFVFFVITIIINTEDNKT